MTPGRNHRRAHGRGRSRSSRGASRRRRRRRRRSAASSAASPTARRFRIRRVVEEKRRADLAGGVGDASRQRARAAEARAVFTYREELVVCAVEAILALRPADEEARAGWRQVAPAAGGAARRAAVPDQSRRTTRRTGRRAATHRASVRRREGGAERGDAPGRPGRLPSRNACSPRWCRRRRARRRADDSTTPPSPASRGSRVDTSHRFSNHSRGRTKCGGRAGGTARTRGGWTGGRTPSRGRGPRRGNRTRGGGAATRGNPRAGEIVRRVVQRVGGVGGWVGVRGTPRREVSAASRGSGEDAGRDALVGGRREHRESGGVSREKSSREISGGGGGRRRRDARSDGAQISSPPASSPPPLALAHLLAGCGTVRAAGAEGDFHLASAARRAAAAATRDARRAREGPAAPSFLVPQPPSRL